MNKTQLLQDIESNVYTNTQKRIKGNTVRDRLKNIVNNVLVVADDANVRYMAINSGRADVSFINAETPVGKFLCDDGTWQEVGSIYTKDADNNVFYEGVTATMGTGCAGNVFHQGATGNTLGQNCTNNIFEQGVSGLIFADNLNNTTIHSYTGIITPTDLTISPDYDFLYNQSYPSEIFSDGSGVLLHKYYDNSNKRYVLTNLSTLSTRFFYAGEFVPYTGATADVDLDTFSLNAKSLHIKGTGGNGHLGLKHQSSGASAGGSESVLYADNSGNPTWKNASGSPISIVLSTSLGSLATVNPTGTPSATTCLAYDGTAYTWRSVLAGSNTQVQYNNNGAAGASSNFTYSNNRLFVGDSGLVSSGSHLDFNVFSNADNRVGINVYATGVGAGPQAAVVLARNTSTYTLIAQRGNNTGNYPGTSVLLTQTFNIQKWDSGNSTSGGIVLAGSQIYNFIGESSTNYGTRLDSVGFRIGTLDVLHNTNGFAFQAGNLTFTDSANALNINNSAGEYRINGTRVVDGRIGGWSAPTGTATRTTFDTGTVTLVQLAERVKAIIDDMISHGLIGT